MDTTAKAARMRDRQSPPSLPSLGRNMAHIEYAKQPDDSMLRAEYPFIRKGMLVFVDVFVDTSELKPDKLVGEIVYAAIRNGRERTIRQFTRRYEPVRRATITILHALNPSYEDYELCEDDQIIGQVVGTIDIWRKLEYT
jgi:SOS-response transcriptional repressor LexA